MPIVKNSNLPTFNRLATEGRQVLDADRAGHQDIRAIHIGLLNIMPDAALEATERQFLRLVNDSNLIAQIHIHPFSLPIIKRGENAQAHIDTYYEKFEDIKEQGLDGLIVTGTNPVDYPALDERKFWQPMIDVIDWAAENVTSTLFSCMASHLALTNAHGQAPVWADDKVWGVYPHRVIDNQHPLVSGMNTQFNVIHSRHRDVSLEQFKEAGLRVLVHSKEAGVHLATSQDGFRSVFMQGHPEYDTNSLLKEYGREVKRFIAKERPDYPPPPKNYFNEDGLEIAKRHKTIVTAGFASEFPEKELEATLDNTWKDSARSLISTWMGLVYQVTDIDRKKPFMPGVDPNDPLSLKPENRFVGPLQPTQVQASPQLAHP